MLTYKKALATVENSKVRFYLSYVKTVDVKSALSRRQGSRHPQLTTIVFDFGNGVEVCADPIIDGNDVEIFYHFNGLEENDVKVQAVKMLTPEILDNYISENEEEIEND